MALHPDIQAKLSDALIWDRAEQLASMLNSTEGGLDISYHDQGGRSLLFLAASEGSKGCVEYLIAAGAVVNDRAPAGVDQNTNRTALNSALSRRKFEVVDLLLGAGANPRIPDHTGQTALHIVISGSARARLQEYPEELARRRLLIDNFVAAGCPIDQVDSKGMTPLMHAVQMLLPLPIIETLLEHGANPRTLDPEGKPPIHHAWRHVPMLRLLVSAGADINACDRQGKTLAYLAKDLDTLQALVETGADLGSTDIQGRTVFAYMVDEMIFDQGQLLKMLYLLHQGADPRQPDFAGQTPLQILEERRDQSNEFVQALRTAINARDAKMAMRAAVPAATHNSP
jgi:ankyrin repeat protein